MQLLDKKRIQFRYIVRGMLILLAISTSIRATCADNVGTQATPNIVLVITDDQGYGEIGFHGNEQIQTPNLDRLAKQSMRLTDFHVSPTCAPTRSCLMTGRHEFKNGVTHTILERERMALSAITIADVLSEAGYETGIFGKWHLGDEAAYQPGKRGFDEVFIHGAGGIGQSYKCSCGDVPGNKYFDTVVRHNGVFKKTSGYCTDTFFDSALDWIEKNKEKKFFAYITTNTPHSPNIAPEKYAKPYLELGMKKPDAHYYGMITNIDDNIGRLAKKLDDLKLADNTLLIFMTDNGHSHGKLFNAGMRGAKGTPYEGGTRVPAFFRWPGHTKANVDVEKLTGHVDMFPTLAEIANAKMPTGVKMDGRSLVGFFENPDADWDDRFLFTHVGRWKHGEAAKSKFLRCAVRTERFRLVKNEELYDLDNDPAESENVIEKFPEQVAKMRKAYDDWWEEVLPLMVNEGVPMATENPFKVDFEKQKGTAGIPIWKPASNQSDD